MKSPQIHPSLSFVETPYPGILLDAWGVFWGGGAIGALPGTRETMRRLVKSGKIVGILSNSTMLAAQQAEKLKAGGLVEGEHFHFLITSGEIARHLVVNCSLPFPTPRHTFWLHGQHHPKYASHTTLFKETRFKQVDGLNEADFIFQSIPNVNGEDQTDPELFRGSVASLKGTGLPMLCICPDHFAHEGNPPKAMVRQGTLAKMYEQLGGEVHYIGKPSTIAYSKAMETFARWGITNPAKVLMVGDTPETDIRGARRYGMRAALITRTGLMSDRIAHHSHKAIQDLPEHDRPDYFLGHLADS